MSDHVKISGRSFKIPKGITTWKFTLRPGGWIIAENAEGIRRRLVFQDQAHSWSASLRGYLWSGTWVQQQREVLNGKVEDLVAQFPGKVRKVLVETGSHVAEGDPLMLVEAMKMEFTIRAPFAAQVLGVLVKEGQQISPGDRFVDLEAKKSG